MITDERKNAAQNVGLDLTINTNQEIISGYLHFEKNNINDNEEYYKFENTIESYYIKTKFSEFNK